MFSEKNFRNISIFLDIHFLKLLENSFFSKLTYYLTKILVTTQANACTKLTVKTLD